MDLETVNPDTVEEIFMRHGAQSVTFTDAGDQPVLERSPGETPAWRRPRIAGLFSPESDLSALAGDLMTTLDCDTLPAHQIVELEDRAWEREWLRDFGPMKFGERLWVLPGDTRANQDGAVTVRLDPGLAFGTGTHATTALCLEWLEAQELCDRKVLDYGCGSGILAIAALKLGCAGAVAFDIAPQAVAATRSNAIENGVANKLHVYGDVDDLRGRFHIVVANILADPLISLAPMIAGHVESGCLLALSGILSEQVDDVRRAYQAWIEFDKPTVLDQAGQTWARLTGRRIED